MTAFYLNEAKFELPDGRRIEDRTVTFLVGRSPRGAALMLLVERRPHAATSTLREAVDEHGRELERGYLGYAVLFDREVEVAGRPAIDVGARGTCKGSNQSPPLVWSRPPDGTASYAVSMADLDAKVGVVWLWLMFNIPASVTALPQNAAADPKLLPAGAAQARNGFDTVGYLGPCPRKDSIAHHYLITVWAVNQPNLPFKDGTPSQQVAIYLRSHALGHASLTPHYGSR